MLKARGDKRFETGGGALDAVREVDLETGRHAVLDTPPFSERQYPPDSFADLRYDWIYLRLMRSRLTNQRDHFG